MAPGTRRSFAVVATIDCKAAWSIGLSAGELDISTDGAVALAPVGVAGVDEFGAGALGLPEHPAIIRTALALKVAT
jgi:hypothetical protein